MHTFQFYVMHASNNEYEVNVNCFNMKINMDFALFISGKFPSYGVSFRSQFSRVTEQQPSTVEPSEKGSK